MPFLIPIGAAIATAGLAVAGSVAAIPIIGGTLVAGVTAATTFAAGLVGYSAAAGVLSLGAAISSWSTVALFASSYLSSKPKVGLGAAGSPIDFQADPNSGIPLMLGRSATAGKVIHANTTGQSNKNAALYYLMALTGGPLGAFEGLIASDYPVTFDGSNGPGTGLATGPPQWAWRDISSRRRVRSRTRRLIIPAAFSLAGYRNGRTRIGSPASLAERWTLVYNTKAYPSGMPKPLFVIRGPGVYDPRADSTFPGGSGPQRWNDEATWTLAGAENPFLQALAWCLGRYDNGKLTFGIGAPIDGIDVAAFIEGANVCEANGWKIGGEVLSSDRKWDVLTAILQAGGGEPIKLGGLISAYVRAPRVALGTLVGKDLIGEAQITGTKRRRDRLNQIIPTYRSEAHKWELVAAGPVFVNEYIAADGGLRSKEGSYPLVQNAVQVGQLATYDILDAREFEPIVLPVGPRWEAIKPGDCIVIDEPEFGMVQQPVVVQTRALDLMTGKVTLTCRSETSGKHDYALGRTATPPPIPGFQPTDPAYVARPDPGLWSAVGTVLTGADGAAVPAIVVTGHCNDPNASGIIVDYQLELSPGVFGEWVSTEFPSSTTRMEFRAVISGATYHVQVRYRSVRNVEGTLAEDLGLVTVGTLISGGVTNIGGQTPQELIDQLNETTELGLETSDKAIQNSADIAKVAADLLPVSASADYSKHRVDLIGSLLPNGSTFQMSDTTLFADATTTWGTWRTSLQANVGANTAAITTEQTTRATADSALSTRIDSVEATSGSNSAAITAEQTARIAADNATATQITNYQHDPKWSYVVDHDASVVRERASMLQWVLAVSATGPGYARVAGIKVAANPAVSSIAFAADQIGFTNGTDNVYPLAVVGGKVIATNFQADDIKANTITANHIVGGAITSTIVTQAGAKVNGVGSDVEDLRFSYTTIGGVCSISVYGELGTSTSAAAGTVFTLYMDGTDSAHIVGQGALYCPGSWGQAGVTFPVAHQPAAGGHTWVLWHRGTSGSGAAQVNRTNVVFTELKR